MVYPFGLYVFAYLPARLELRLGRPVALFEMVGCVIAVIGLEWLARRPGSLWSVQPTDELDENALSDATTLDLGGIIPSANHLEWSASGESAPMMPTTFQRRARGARRAHPARTKRPGPAPRRVAPPAPRSLRDRRELVVNRSREKCRSF
jgi:hypothetical protein